MRPEELVGIAGRRAPHRGAGLRQEVLDDHLLHVAVAGVGRRRSRRGRRAARARVSPMPTRMPVVNGTRARPAASSVASRRSGVLSGAPACGPPGSPSRAASVSIIIPCDGDDRAEPERDPSSASAPALAWGSRPVSVEHRARPPPPGSRRWRRTRARRATPPHAGYRASGASPRVNSASWQPSAAPRRAMASTSSSVEVRATSSVGGRLGEGAVAARVAAQHRERDEHLRRERDARPVGGVAPGRRLRHELARAARRAAPRRRRAGRRSGRRQRPCSGGYPPRGGTRSGSNDNGQNDNGRVTCSMPSPPDARAPIRRVRGVGDLTAVGDEPLPVDRCELVEVPAPVVEAVHGEEQVVRPRLRPTSRSARRSGWSRCSDG